MRVAVLAGLVFSAQASLAARSQLGLAQALPPLPAPVRPVAAVLPALRPPPSHHGAHDPALSDPSKQQAYLDLRHAMQAEVPASIHPGTTRLADMVQRAKAMITATDTPLEQAQLAIVVDRNPAVQTLAIFVAQPEGDGPWLFVGATHVSTGQAGRKEYYITPVGVFPHTDAILDFRALGTYNEHHVRGLGLAGERVWDFGWQWAIKGWRDDGEGGDIRLQMHATDPVLLEGRIGRPASEGCVRIPTSLNKFLDRHGVLDADYERVAATDVSYRALLLADRTPSPLAGRLLIVVDSRDAVDEPPTAASRPPDWPLPGMTDSETAPGADATATATQ